MRLFTLCSYLKTKESYDRWLQGDFGDLDNKYLKQNIPKYLKMSVENIRKLQKNTAALYIERKTLRASVIRRSGYVWPEKLKRPPLPSGVRRRMWNIRSEDPDMSDQGSWNVLLSHPDVRYPDKVECRPDRVLPRVEWAMPSACARCRDPSLWWHGARKAIRINSIWIPQEDLCCNAIWHSWTSLSEW